MGPPIIDRSDCFSFLSLDVAVLLHTASAFPKDVITFNSVCKSGPMSPVYTTSGGWQKEDAILPLISGDQSQEEPGSLSTQEP